ncbi:MAG: helix-turn-helix domain-containing protein [Frankiales bacterium]|nr:helix-turn-helix domain-containing protein [Frankiales bacterium]
MLLVGAYEGSGYREPHYLAQQADGSMVQLTDLLYEIARATDGRRTPAQVAVCVREATGHSLGAACVRALVETELRPAGVIAQADGSSPTAERVNPLLALKTAGRVIPASVVQRLGRLLAPLMNPVLMVIALLAYAVGLSWLLLAGAQTAMVGQLAAMPGSFLIILAMLTLSAAWHELGHAAACVRGGARPGVIGAGIYLVWPAFYTDVTDAYRLNRKARLRVDFGGLYFNVLCTLVLLGAYAVTGSWLLVIAVLLVQLQMLQQLLPFLRFDGYYALADATGVPDLFLRIRPILKSLLPGRSIPEPVRELRPRVRVVVAVWVVSTVLLLAGVLVWTVLRLPLLYVMAAGAFGEQLGTAIAAAGRLDLVAATAALLGAATTLLLPAALTFVLYRLAARIGTGLRGRQQRSHRAQDRERPGPAVRHRVWRLQPRAELAVPARFALTDEQVQVLKSRSASAAPKRAARTRARIVLAAGLGWPDDKIGESLRVSRSTVGRWRRRFASDGIPGLDDRGASVQQD